MIFRWLHRRPRLRRVPEPDGIVLELTRPLLRVQGKQRGVIRVSSGAMALFGLAICGGETIFRCEVQHRPVPCGSSCQPRARALANTVSKSWPTGRR
jgi:hypothetical protein